MSGAAAVGCCPATGWCCLDATCSEHRPPQPRLQLLLQTATATVAAGNDSSTVGDIAMHRLHSGGGGSSSVVASKRIKSSTRETTLEFSRSQDTVKDTKAMHQNANACEETANEHDNEDDDGSRVYQGMDARAASDRTSCTSNNNSQNQRPRPGFNPTRANNNLKSNNRNSNMSFVSSHSASSTLSLVKKDPTSHRLIEKRRRDRMNNCLTDLSKLIPLHYLKKGRGRVEKTEIIEMAIKHMRKLHELRENGSSSGANNCNESLKQQEQLFQHQEASCPDIASRSQLPAVAALTHSVWPGALVSQDTPLAPLAHMTNGRAAVAAAIQLQLHHDTRAAAAPLRAAYQSSTANVQQQQEQNKNARTHHKRHSAGSGIAAQIGYAHQQQLGDDGASPPSQNWRLQSKRCRSLGSSVSSGSSSSSSLESSSPSGNERSPSADSSSSANDLSSIAASTSGAISLDSSGASFAPTSANCTLLIQSMRRVVSAVEVVAIAMKSVTEQLATVLDAKSVSSANELNKRLTGTRRSINCTLESVASQQQQRHMLEAAAKQEYTIIDQNQHQTQASSNNPSSVSSRSASPYAPFASSTITSNSNTDAKKATTNSNTASSNTNPDTNLTRSHPRQPIKLSLKRYEYGCKHDSTLTSTERQC